MTIWIKDQSPNPVGEKFHNCSLLNSWTKVSLIFKHGKDRMIAAFTWTWDFFSSHLNIDRNCSFGSFFWRWQLNHIFLLFLFFPSCTIFHFPFAYFSDSWVCIDTITTSHISFSVVEKVLYITVYFAWIAFAWKSHSQQKKINRIPT